MEKTESALKKWCKSKNYFSKKFLTHTAQGHGGNQEADFLVASDTKVWVVECKERHGNLFEFSGLTQEKKMKLLMKRTKAITPIIIINFEDYKTLVRFDLATYLEFKSKCFFKNGKPRESMNIKDIPSEYKFTWKTLVL